MICIYEHKPGAGASVLGNSGGANIENWRTKLVLRGHSNNVVDLGWSPDDSKLASASIDNAVCIWDTATGHRLKTLDFHTSFVKGLAWDPVGTYLATQVRACVCWQPGHVPGQLLGYVAVGGQRSEGLQGAVAGRAAHGCRHVGMPDAAGKLALLLLCFECPPALPHPASRPAV
jgi:hypothetical protein